MIRKKQLLQNDLIETKETTNVRNARVTVQYIQNQQLFPKPYNTSKDRNLVHAAAQDDIEIENVEYLEETPNIEEYIEDPSDKEEFEDNFYPNAVHCLLDLYKIKYETLNTENSDYKVAHLWRDIAKDMKESFFEFSEGQIHQKYSLLRAQYFAVGTKEDVENFDYFVQLHDIYKDPSKENIAKGLYSTKCSSVYYKDEVLHSEDLEISENDMRDIRSKEIVHKEHEFIDMVEKELQAMEDGVQLDNSKETAENNTFKRNSDHGVVSHELKAAETEIEEPPHRVKRIRLDSEAQRKTNSNEYFEYNEAIQGHCRSSAKTDCDFSLYHYNQEQERRHREHMSLIDKSLKIQERALEQQQQLLKELIKRLHS